VKTSAKTLATQLEAAKRSETVKGLQINKLQNKIKGLETGVAQNMRQIDDLGDEIGDLTNKLKVRSTRVRSTRGSFSGNILNLHNHSSQNKRNWPIIERKKEADSAKEIDRLKSDQILARQMSVTNEATIDTLRHQLNVAREKANRQALPAHTNALRYRGPLDSPQTPMDVPDSFRYRGPIDTPQIMMDGSNVREMNLILQIITILGRQQTRVTMTR